MVAVLSPAPTLLLKFVDELGLKQDLFHFVNDDEDDTLAQGHLQLVILR